MGICTFPDDLADEQLLLVLDLVTSRKLSAEQEFSGAGAGARGGGSLFAQRARQLEPTFRPGRRRRGRSCSRRGRCCRG
jgi:hypothetical protein